MKHTTALLAIALILCVYLSDAARAQDRPAEVTVELDVSQVQDQPKLVEWGERACELILEWHPRIVNLLATKGFEPTTEIHLTIRKSDEGVAHASGNRIVVMSSWIEAHPDDIGLVAHELTHVIQRYRGNTPTWVTEGIADYVRWAIFEGKPQAWFHRPDEVRGYRQGYRTTAGFLLWLESDLAPGIVGRLNTAARTGRYDDDLFEEHTGTPLDELWDAYRSEQ